MSKLKKSIVKRIILELEQGKFCKEDFNLSFPSDTGELVKIEFILDSRYSFKVIEAVSGVNALLRIGGIYNNDPEAKSFFQTLESPGDYKNAEKKNFKTIDDCINRISNWLSNLHEDLILRDDHYVDLDDFTESLRKQFDERVVENPDSYFTDDEGEHLKTKLNQLSQKLAELEKKFNLEKKDITPLEAAIKNSEENIKNYPKKIWYKTSGNKILSALKKITKSKEVRDFLLEAAKKYFLS